MKVINVHSLTTMCEAILDGEPVFIIRAQDYLSVEIVQNYLNKAIEHEAKNLTRVRDVIAAMIEWRKVNPKKVKIPD